MSKNLPLHNFLPTPAKFGRRPFPRLSVDLFTEWQPEWQNGHQKETSDEEAYFSDF